MRINGIDIKTYNAVQSSVLIEHAEIKTSANWNVGALTPTFINREPQFKNITLVLGIKGASKEIIEENKSNILTLLSKKCVCNFDNYTHNFVCFGALTTTEVSNKKFTQVSITLQGYEEANEVSVTFQKRVTVNNPGNAITPAILEFVTDVGLAALTISGLTDEHIIVRNVAAGTPLIIDGEKCTIKQGTTNKFSDSELWEFPKLAPGNTKVVLSDENGTAVLKFKSRFN